MESFKFRKSFIFPFMPFIQEAKDIWSQVLEIVLSRTIFTLSGLTKVTKPTDVLNLEQLSHIKESQIN